MAVNLLTTYTSTSSEDPSTTSSFSPTADALLVVVVATANGGASPNTHDSVSDTLTGTGTWTKQTSVAHDAANQNMLSLWTALAGSSPGTGTVSVDYSSTVSRIAIAVFEVTGQDASPVVQTATNTGTSSTLAVTLGSSPSASNVVIGAVHSNGDTDGISPGSGFTELADITSGSSAAAALEVEYDDSPGSTTVDWSGLSTNSNGALAIEIALSGGGASPVTVSASPGVVPVSGIQASISSPIVVQASPATLQVVGVQASVSSAVVVGAQTAQLGAAGQQATVAAPIVISASPGVVSVAGVPASVVVEVSIAVEETVTGAVDGGTSLSLTSWAPQADELILLAVAVRDESVTVTPSGNGLTWVEVADVDNVQGQCGIAVFRAMGSSPSSGQISVSLSGSTVAVAIASRFSGVDTSGTNGSGAVEAFATNSGPDPDDDDMVANVTTATAEAWAWAAGTHRLTTFTVPADETAISINQSEGSGGDTTSLSTWYKEIASATTEELGAAADLSGDSDWATIGVSIKPAFVGPVSVGASPGVVSVSGPAATVEASTTILAGTAQLQALGVQASVGVFVSVSASPGVISVSGAQATIVAPQVIGAAPGVVSVVGVGASVAITDDVTVAAGVGVIQVIGVPVFVDTVRYLLDPVVSDAAAYTVELSDAIVYSVALGDAAPYSVELEDASRS